MNNCHRFQRIVELITPLLTAASQRRLEATMEDAYSKAMTKEGATPESVAQATVIIAEKANAYASVENANRIRQWAEAILAAELNWIEDNVDKKV